MNRIDRLSGILVMLQSSHSVKPKQIMQRYSIGIRTVYRDLKALEESGIPITGDSRVGYSLVEGYKLPPLMFSHQEAFAFLAAEKLVVKFVDQSLKRSFRSGVDKIKAVMSFADKKLIDDVDKKLGTLEFKHQSFLESNDHLQKLIASISTQYKLRITYHSQSKNEFTDRVVEPVGLFFSLANWYLVAYCNERSDYRTFRISRISNIQILNVCIEKKHPSLDVFLNKLQKRENLEEVIIHVSKKDLYLIDNRKYYQGLVSETEIGENVELRFMTFSLQNFSRWAISYLDFITIVCPNKLDYYISDIIAHRKYH